MCVIIIKDKGYELSWKQYEAAYDSNPDGWGIMFAKDGKVEVLKGMTKTGYMEALKKIRGLAAVIHTRWATHGAKNVENCHPFRLTEKVWIAHNGVIGVPMVDEGRSDTYNFAEYILGPTLRANPKLFGTSQLERYIMEIAGPGNRFAMLHANGEIQIVNESAGSWIGKGIWVSNLRSIVPQRYVPTYQSYTAPYYGRSLPFTTTGAPASTSNTAVSKPAPATGHATRDSAATSPLKAAVDWADKQTAKRVKKNLKKIEKMRRKKARKLIAAGKEAVGRRNAYEIAREVARERQAVRDKAYMAKVDRLRSMWDANGRPTGKSCWPAET